MDTTDPLISVFTLVLRNTLWATATGLALALVWRRLPVWSRYGLGLLLVGRLLLPVTPASPWSAANWWRATGSATPAVVHENPVFTIPGAPRISVTEPVAAEVLSPAAKSRSAATWFSWLWLAGAVFFALRLVRRQVAFTRWWKAGRAPAAEAWGESLAACRADMPVRRTVRLWSVAGLSSPLACGVFRPCILVPSGLENALSSAERAHILRHELAHHRHFDLVWNLFFATAAALHWFNPLVHAGLSRLVREREIRRDADAVRACRGADAADYGDTLLKLVTLLPRRTAAAPVASAMLGISHLKQRLTMIPKHHQPVTPAARLLFTTAAAALTLLTFTQAQDNAPPAQPLEVENSAEAPPGTRGNTTQNIVFKLQNTIIPSMKFEDATMEDVAGFLRRESINNDALTTDPEEKGIDIILKGQGKTPITCDVRQVRLGDAVKIACDLGGYVYRLEPNAVVMTRKDLVDYKTTQTRVYRFNEDIARAWGWRPGTPDPFSKIIADRIGMKMGEGWTASFSPATERLVVRMTVPQLDELEVLIDQSYKSIPSADFQLSTQGIRNADGKGLSDPEFTAALKTIFDKNPASIIRILGAPEVDSAKLSAVLAQVRAAGLKNLDCVIRDESTPDQR